MLKHTLTAAVAFALWAGTASAQNGNDYGVLEERATLFAPVYRAHDQILTRFRSLGSAAIAPRATRHDHVSFLRFLHAEVLSQLHREGIVLYPVFDSLTDGNYATTAALFDRQAIGRLVDQLGDSVAYRDPTVFKARSYAIATALESYFTKTQFLVLPVVHQRLGKPGIVALLAGF